MSKAEREKAVKDLVCQYMAGEISRNDALLKMATLTRTKLKGKRAKTWPHMKLSSKRHVSQVQLSPYPERAKCRFFEKMDFYRKVKE